jgi:peptidoglycan/xylan/chitin deacetylase (PgdA/CDA1 family)
MRKFCFTVDVDRDVNECIPGRTEAVSLRCGGNARYTSSEEGTNVILEMLDDIGMNATFFAEARTLENINVTFGKNEVAMHGLDHEDMTGESSKITLSEDELNDIMKTSASIIKERTGNAPKGFRAPYMRTDERIMKALRRTGVKYDSSLYSELNDTMLPYEVFEGIKEIPVPVTTDRNGKKMYGYLWSMHEGIRTADEYVKMSKFVENGVFVLATHSWHIVESRNALMNKEQRKKNIENLRDVITGVLDGGYKAVRMSDAL